MLNPKLVGQILDQFVAKMRSLIRLKNGEGTESANNVFIDEFSY